MCHLHLATRNWSCVIEAWVAIVPIASTIAGQHTWLRPYLSHEPKHAHRHTVAEEDENKKKNCTCRPDVAFGIRVSESRKCVLGRGPEPPHPRPFHFAGRSLSWDGRSYSIWWRPLNPIYYIWHTILLFRYMGIETLLAAPDFNTSLSRQFPWRCPHIFSPTPPLPTNNYSFGLHLNANHIKSPTSSRYL